MNCINGAADGLYVDRKLESMPRMGVGTAGLGSKTMWSVCAQLMAGFRLIDTAQAPEWYAEKNVGDALRHCWTTKGKNISDITIVTKVHPRSYAPEVLAESLQTSITNLYGESKGEPGDRRPLDVVLLHAPFCWQGHCSPQEESYTWEDGWKALEAAYNAETVRAIGVSNFDVRLLQKLMDIANVKPAVVQNWMDPYHQDIEVRDFCKTHNIVYMAYSSFGTQWTHKRSTNPVLTSLDLQMIASKNDKSLPDVVLSWLIQEGVVAIPRSTSDEHIVMNARMLPLEDRWGQGEADRQGIWGYGTFLNETDMEAIRKLDGKLGSLW